MKYIRQRCCMWIAHLSAGLLSFNMLLFMLSTNNTNISAKALRAAKESLGELIESTAAVAGWFQLLYDITDDAKEPLLDKQVLSECSQMFITVNRLLYQEESRLKHLQMMRIVSEKADKSFRELRADAKTQDHVLFNQAM